jgi:para-nitrobenzyl esterase
MHRPTLALFLSASLAFLSGGCIRLHHPAQNTTSTQEGSDAPVSPRGKTAGPITQVGNQVQAQLAEGTIQGNTDGASDFFLGIPYAQPPVGALRWQPPAPLEPWPGVLDTANYPSLCPQLLDGQLVGNENCLYLNVWAPKEVEEAQTFPVMVFVHGGGYTIGGASQQFSLTPGNGFPLYDSSTLASTGKVIVVIMQYRLGLLGFLAHPGLAAEQQTGTTGNYGMLDQIAVLQWVQRNIAAVGGDKNRVTVFGESGGAISMCAFLASPLTAGLFSGVIAESEHCDSIPMQVAIGAGEQASADLGCRSSSPTDSVSCLRNLDVSALVNEAQAIQVGTSPSDLLFKPAIDGYLLSSAPDSILAAGKQNQVPVLLGSNQYEAGYFFQKLGGDPTSFAQGVEQSIGAAPYQELLSLYPANQYGSSQDVVTRMSP